MVTGPVVADPVREALGDGRPVVALESTIFTHGLPRPRNLEVALAAEESLRALGVVPATIGVLRGVPTVGLTADQIRELGADDDVIKVSLRDLPIAAAQRRSGGTTVAGTAFLAARAGIAVFATGGLGGVHRGASETFDESADLPVLAQTPILMVSAGVKSILDVGASLERLETLSITLVGYRTTRFPGFYLADSGFAIDYAVDDPRRGRRPGPGPRRPRRARRDPRGQPGPGRAPARPGRARPGAGRGPGRHGRRGDRRPRRHAVPPRPRPAGHRGPQPRRQRGGVREQRARSPGRSPRALAG